MLEIEREIASAATRVLRLDTMEVSSLLDNYTYETPYLY